MITVPYKLQYIKGSDFIDITDFVEALDKYTDVGTGEIVSSKIMLDSRAGEFVTENNNNTTPIISQYDTFLLTLYHDDDTEYKRFLLQDDISPQKNEEGTHIILNLFGRERYLQKMYFTGHYFWINFSDMLTTIQTYYNDNRGTDQPFLLTYVADLQAIPKYTYSSFNFGDNTTVYDAMMEVVNRFKLSVASGGAGEFYGLVFIDDFIEEHLVYRIRPSGKVTGGKDGTAMTPIKTLEKPMLTTAVKEPSLGNIQIVQGAPKSGSMPRGPSVWQALIEEYENIRAWISDITYPKDSYVTYQDRVYQSTAASTAGSTPTGAGWSTVKFKDFVQNETGETNFSYSPLTQNKASVWRNRCGNAASGFLVSAVPDGKTAYNALAIWDSNLVIRDTDAWRDWADVMVSSEADIPVSRLYPADDTHTDIHSRVYHGFRVLITGTRGVPFDVPDKNGKSFANAIAQMDNDGDWIVYRNARQFDECAVISDALVYEFNRPPNLIADTIDFFERSIVKDTTSLAWRQTGGKVAFANDCFHYPAVFTNTPGLLGEKPGSNITLDNGEGKRFTDESGILIEFHMGNTVLGEVEDSIVRNLIAAVQGTNAIIGGAFSLTDVNGHTKANTAELRNLLWQSGWYNGGWYAPLWSAPDPLTTNNFITEKVGSLFGGTVDNKRPTLDINNLNNTPSGNTGYGHDDSDLLGKLDGISFLLNFDIEGFDVQAIQGNIPFRAFIYDIRGNVWISDFNYRRQGETEEISLAFSSFKIYRARVSYAFTFERELDIIRNPELKITDIFEQRFVKRIGVQCMLFHDNEGRFDPLTWENAVRTIVTFWTGTTVKFKGIIDAFHFTKTAVAIARDKTAEPNSAGSRHLVAPIKKMPGFTNVRQLEKIASSELDVSKHQNEYWTLRYDGSPGVKAEDSVYIKDIDFISGAENIDETNTRKYIVKKITYSIGDRASNSGLVSTIEVYRRINT